MVPVKRLLLATVLLLAALPACTASPTPKPEPATDDSASSEPPAPPQNPKAEKIINDSLLVCSGKMSVTRVGMQHRLPEHMVGTVIRTDSDLSSCKGQFLSIVSHGQDHYFGMPWFLDDEDKLPTIEEKIKDFTWKAMQLPFEVRIDHMNPTRDGLYPVTLTQQFEAGKVPLEGVVDPEGKVFFMGHFMPLDADASQDRLKAFAPYVAKAPTEGAAAPKVTIIEFSDFECPSCKSASGFLDPILKKYPEVKYVRYDLPLMMLHPWAFSAALAGRAIYHQKPEVFWEYKKQVYSNQDKLSAFTIDEFARHFAEDHELDLKKYDADLASPEIHADILKGVGAAFANNILGTPTYVVNGRIVDAGAGGVGLNEYLAKLMGK
jgi:protein-disulfide isomerase